MVGSCVVNELLHKIPDAKVIQYDGMPGTATIAAAGIIAPWLSKRRNKKWYKLARLGAEYLAKLAQQNKMPLDVYNPAGVVYTRDSQEKINELQFLYQKRLSDAPLMGEAKVIDNQELRHIFPFIESNDSGFYVPGGARIDGLKFINFLNHKNSQVQRLHEVAHLKKDNNQILVNDEEFDQVVVAAGAWSGKVVELLGVNLKVRAQKGQLIEVTLPNQQKTTEQMPVLMPEGERDFIPTADGKLLIGATHENDEGFDLTVSPTIEADLLASGQRLITDLNKADIKQVRVGTRAYTDDFAPFFGYLPGYQNVLVASGLGSSGLTTGPMIGKLLVDLLMNPSESFPDLTKPVLEYYRK